MIAPLPVVILISGRGSNMRALADGARRGDLPIEIRAVISDRADAPGLQSARELGIATASLALREFPTRAAFDFKLAELVASYQPQLVLLAGYMKILSTEFVRQFTGRLLNIHPSLLPRYPGLHTHRRALAGQDRKHGASVHFVIEALDSGPIIIQGTVAIQPDDNELSLAARVQRTEHIIYAQAVDWFARGRLKMRDGNAWLDGKPLATPIVNCLDNEDLT